MEIFVIDSLGKGIRDRKRIDTAVAENVARFFCILMNIPEGSIGPLTVKQANIPSQPNIHDCGVIMLKAMEIWDGDEKYNGKSMPEYTTSKKGGETPHELEEQALQGMSETAEKRGWTPVNDYPRGIANLYRNSKTGTQSDEHRSPLDKTVNFTHFWTCLRLVQVLQWWERVAGDVMTPVNDYPREIANLYRKSNTGTQSGEHRSALDKKVTFNRICTCLRLVQVLQWWERVAGDVM
ncbi:hypothetical protein LR48_Vigan738s000200 [Vigna angularis]|uniref:Ubiquitin-like protease family profile domain-containing protein n=1 Tax=Phaseolus angularis TaxID=3914 RepID=A0A0L9TGQ9_PHAAN|nr:hypothetical protein LR48_Vigan738s000200 [Vigna angularis]